MSLVPSKCVGLSGTRSAGLRKEGGVWWNALHTQFLGSAFTATQQALHVP